MLNKKRIFIAMHYLEIGGVETSLFGLLSALDKNKYSIDLFLYSHRGEGMKRIPNGVHVLPERMDYSLIESPLRLVLKMGYFRIFAARMWAKIRFLFYKSLSRVKDSSAVYQYIANAVTPQLSSLKEFGTYDLAISFLTPHNIVRDKVLAKKKLCWIHSDYSSLAVNVGQELPVWDSYDYIASISPSVTDAFLNKFPSLKEKMTLIPNILSAGALEALSQEQSRSEIIKEMPKKSGEILLLSVGRFAYAKNYDNIPYMVHRLTAMGASVKWFIIGYGQEEKRIKDKIASYQVENRVILLGKRTNPYPYISACDYYVQPSRFEGCSVAVREALILKKRVIIANYATARAQMKDGEDGLIVPLDKEGMAKGIMRAISDEDSWVRISSYLKRRDYTNFDAVQKIDKILNE